MSKAVFVTGTGTDVGKTYVTGLLLKALAKHHKNIAYYKAAMSGNVRHPDGTLIPGDALQVKWMSGIAQSLESMCPYVYETAVSPHLASKLEGNPVELSVVKQGFRDLTKTCDYITVEGSGGILCPIRYDEKRLLLEDIVKKLRLPSLLVANAGLGTINQVVLTVDYMRHRQLPMKGIILNHFISGDVMQEDNLRMCEELTGLPVLACVSDHDTELHIDAGVLTGLYEEVALL